MSVLCFPCTSVCVYEEGIIFLWLLLQMPQMLWLKTVHLFLQVCRSEAQNRSEWAKSQVLAGWLQGRICFLAPFQLLAASCIAWLMAPLHLHSHQGPFLHCSTHAWIKTAPFFTEVWERQCAGLLGLWNLNILYHRAYPPEAWGNVCATGEQ